MSERYEEAVRKAEAVKDTPAETEGLTPVKARIKEHADTVYSLRFTQAEMALLRSAAKKRGIKLSELIREGALQAAGQVQDVPSPRERAIQEARDLVGAAAKMLDRISRS